MTQLMPDKAEFAVEFPEKQYAGTFEGTARFDAHLDNGGVSLTLLGSDPAAPCKSVHIYLHYALFAEILQELAKTVSAFSPEQVAQRDLLRDATKALYLSLTVNPDDDVSTLTPEEEVRLLHILE